MISDAGCIAGSPTIAVVGYSARAAAQSAKAQGFKVVAVDLCLDRDLLDVCSDHYRLDDPNWPDALDSQHPTASLLWTGGMENRNSWVERCHSHVNRFGANAVQLQAMRKLAGWEEWAVSAKLNWPKTFRGDELGSIPLASMASSEWLIKPFQSGGGIGTIDFDANRESPNQRDVYLQKRMPGETIGVTFLSSSVGSAFVGATAAWPQESNERANRYVYRGSYGPIPLSKNNIDKLQRFATIAGRESGLLGVWQADFLLHENELTLLEINPRWSASMDLLDVGFGLQLVEKHEMCVRGMMTSRSLNQLAMNASAGAMAPQARMMGKRIVYASHPWIVTDTQSDLWWSNRWNMDSSAAIQSCQFADIPTAGTSISAGGPILTLMTAGDSKESMLKTLETERSHLRDIAG